MQNSPRAECLLAMPYAATWASVPVLVSTAGFLARVRDQLAESRQDRTQAGIPDQV